MDVSSPLRKIFNRLSGRDARASAEQAAMADRRLHVVEAQAAALEHQLNDMRRERDAAASNLGVATVRVAELQRQVRSLSLQGATEGTPAAPSCSGKNADASRRRAKFLIVSNPRAGS